MQWTLDALIRQSLQQAAQETELSDEQKSNMLHALTEFIRAQNKQREGPAWT